MQRHRVSALSELDSLGLGENDSDDDDDEIRAESGPGKRKMHYDSNNLAANCVVVPPESLGVLVDNSEKGQDGLIFGFASDMKGIGNIPEATYLQILSVLRVLNSEDEITDILPDANVSFTTKGKNPRVENCIVSSGGNSGNYSTNDLWKKDPADLRGAVSLMAEDSESGRAETKRLFAGMRKNFKSPMKNGKLFLTSHRVEYSVAGKVDSFQVMVLWVVCHRNFDFVGKLHRLYGDPSKWRKWNIAKSNANEEAKILLKEAAYSDWSNVLLSLVESIPLTRIWRDWEQRRSEDPMNCILNDMDPEAFYTLTNPWMVYMTITWMCPDNSDSIRVEGMDYTYVSSCSLTLFQYMRRYVAWRRMFTASKRQQKAAEAEKKNKKGKGGGETAAEEGGAEAEAEAEEDEDGQGGGDGEDLPDEDEFFAGGDMEHVVHALARGESSEKTCFDDNGRALLVNLLGWPTNSSTEDDLITGIPNSGNVVLYLDMSALNAEMTTILGESCTYLEGRFGEIPLSASASIQASLMRNAEDENVGESFSFLPDAQELPENKRRKIYAPGENPLQGYLYDKVYESMLTCFYQDMLQREVVHDPLSKFKAFVQTMRGHMRSDLLSGKAHSMVLKSSQTYVDSLRNVICSDAWNVMAGTHKAEAQTCRSDFQLYESIYYKILNDTNNKYWMLQGRNLFLVMNFNCSEILWRCGTAGDWMWMGMTLCVLDGAGLLLSKGGTNQKKAGTSGFDYSRSAHKVMRIMYKATVSRTTQEQFQDDGHSISSTMRFTPASVKQGVVVVIDDKVVTAPSANLGTMVVAPEGLGEGEVLDQILCTIPRDGEMNVDSHSTADPLKNGVRKPMKFVAVRGFLLQLMAFCRNGQPSDVRALNRFDDFSRAITEICSGGPEDEDVVNKAKHNKRDTMLPWFGCGQSTTTAGARSGPGPPFSEADLQKHACYFSMVPMVTGLICMQQKLGMIRWNLSPPVHFVLGQLRIRCVDLLKCMMSKIKVNHCTRFFDSAISMAGVAPTVMIRTYGEVAASAKTSGIYDRFSTGVVLSVEDAMDHVTQLQCEDAVHYSRIPAVLMRFLTGMLDFPLFAILSCFFRAVKMPIISLHSVLEFTNGMPISNAGDKRRVEQYMAMCLRKKMLCMASAVGGDLNQNDNIMAYVTTQFVPGVNSPMRMGFSPLQAGTNNLEKFISDQLRLNVGKELGPELKLYSQFCKDHPQISIDAALEQMQAVDFNLCSFFGGGGLFYEHKKLFQTLMGPSAFNGIPSMGVNEHSLLRILPVGQTSIAYGINIPTALMLSSLMQSHRRDWGLQQNMAESIVKFLCDVSVPVSLLSVTESTMDSFKTQQGIMRTVFENRFRPLQMTRYACPSPFEQDLGKAGDRGLGISQIGMFEDTAHMCQVLSMAEKFKLEYWDVNLLSWNFEINWGVEGSITPLRWYKRNTLRSPQIDGFSAGAARIGYVVVSERNLLTLVVQKLDSDEIGDEALEMVCGEVSADRMKQQEIIFAHGWGPALKFHRPGVVLHCDRASGSSGPGLVTTLVPYGETLTTEEMISRGWNDIKFFEGGYYKTQTSDTVAPVKLRVEEVEAKLLPYGTRVAVDHSSPEMEEYKMHSAQVPRSVLTGNRHTGFQLARLVTDDALVPNFGLVPVMIKVSDGKQQNSVRRINVLPEHIRVFNCEEDWKGCHPHIKHNGLVQAEREQSANEG